VLAPDEFLPLVRRYGLTGRVNDFVVNKALDEVLEWQAAAFHVLVSSRQVISMSDWPAAGLEYVGELGSTRPR
jgi:EAL domain-containing protein (putative c-di-GMP-specific phosphodiesterase class I)